jgi:hypothetical protein
LRVLNLLLSASPSLRFRRGLNDLCLNLIGPILEDLLTEEHHRRLTFVFSIDVIYASMIFLQFFVLWLR